MSLRLMTLAAAAAAAICHAAAPEHPFDSVFADRTLRLDYIFAADSLRPAIYLDHMTTTDGWSGRRSRLAELPLRGNGRVTVTDAATGDTIYRNAFSSLFHEWIVTDMAPGEARSFENVFIVPQPRDSALITIDLTDASQRPLASLTHPYSPRDILVADRSAAGRRPHRYLHGSAERAREAIDIAIVGEGYTQAEMPLFYADAQRAAEALFSYEPFAGRQDDFNIVAVETPSADSGISVPAEGLWLDTAFGSNFSTFYSDRYLTAPRISRLHDALLNIPYEHIIILANTDTYGGGGIFNSYLMASTRHKDYRPVTVHEFGHSFAGLADEYFYTGDVMEDTYPEGTEPWEPNITTLADFGSKWADMTDSSTPVPTPDSLAGSVATGVFEGGGYSAKGVYRPAYDCRMRTNTAPDFCPVCMRAINRIIDFYTGR